MIWLVLGIVVRLLLADHKDNDARRHKRESNQDEQHGLERREVVDQCLG